MVKQGVTNQRSGSAARRILAVKEFDWQDLAVHTIEVRNGTFIYHVGGLDEGDCKKLIDQLPDAHASINGARLAAYELTDETENAKPGWHFFVDQTLNNFLEENGVYRLENLTQGVREPALHRPLFRAVSVDVTTWGNLDVTKVIGRTQAIHAYDANSVSYLSELTPYYMLVFVKNVCERPFMNLTEEGDIEKMFQSIGFETQRDFETEDGGEIISYYHTRNIDRKISSALTTNVSFQFEYMFETDEGQRLRMFEELIRELDANGYFSDVGRFQNGRTDAEILKDAPSLEYGSESPLSTPGM